MKLFRRLTHEPIEPDWDFAIVDPEERKAVAAHWRIIRDALRGGIGLAPWRDHAMIRLAVAYLLFDRAAPELIRNGAGDVRGDVTCAWQVAHQASAMATAIELELGLVPRQR